MNFMQLFSFTWKIPTFQNEQTSKNGIRKFYLFIKLFQNDILSLWKFIRHPIYWKRLKFYWSLSVQSGQLLRFKILDAKIIRNQHLLMEKSNSLDY